MDEDERSFQRRYGRWSPLSPIQAAALLRGLGCPTWVAGGWALQAFTGIAREHEDIDVGFFRRDVTALVNHLEPEHQAFAVGEGMTIRGLTPQQPELPEWADQVWVREHAAGPWLADMLATDDADGRWIFKRDPSMTAAVDQITWIDDAGVRYLRPEVVLAFKAKLNRPKDREDLAAVLPLLSQDQQRWLREAIGRAHPGHAWLSDQLR
jgi:hypothetical protein